MVSSFFDLKSMIVKACKAKSDALDFEGKHCFNIDMTTLNNIFIQKGLDYHVMAGTTNLESYIPYMSDIHTISDYVETEGALEGIMDGYTQIAIFSIYSTHNKNGEIAIEKDDKTRYTGKDLFTACNNEKKADVSLMGMIIKQLPVYKVMVARKFKPKTDSFVYEVYFRSNNQMTAYYRSMVDKKKNTDNGSVDNPAESEAE